MVVSLTYKLGGGSESKRPFPLYHLFPTYLLYFWQVQECAQYRGSSSFALSLEKLAILGKLSSFPCYYFEDEVSNISQHRLLAS